MYPSIIKKESVTIVIDNKPVTILSECKGQYDGIIEAIRNKDWDLVKTLSSKAEQIKTFAKGKLEVRGRQIYYDGEEVHGHITERILNFIDEGLDSEPLMNFLEKLMNNPSKNSIDQLYGFLEHGNMPIDPDGDFYAYKAVRQDWTDKHTGKHDNSIGQVLEMPRRSVDDNPQNDCSNGFHAGSIEYVKGFTNRGDKVILVKINPGDIVAVPSYDTSKMRCCRYEVVAEYTGTLTTAIYDYDDVEDSDDCCNECGKEWSECDC